MKMGSSNRESKLNRPNKSYQTATAKGFRCDRPLRKLNSGCVTPRGNEWHREVLSRKRGCILLRNRSETHTVIIGIIDTQALGVTPVFCVVDNDPQIVLIITNNQATR